MKQGWSMHNMMAVKRKRRPTKRGAGPAKADG